MKKKIRLTQFDFACNAMVLDKPPLLVLKPILKMLHTLTLEAKIKSNFQKDQIKCWFLKNAKIDF